MTGAVRDIAELDALAHEIKVCLDKSGNYLDTARQRLATIAPALEAGEFGDVWNTRRWLFEYVTDSGADVQRLFPRPRERIQRAIEVSPHLSDRAIAKETGANQSTVSRVRASTDAFASVQRVGLDGKERRVPIREPRPRVELDPVETVMVAVGLLTPEDFNRFKARFRAYCGG